MANASQALRELEQLRQQRGATAARDKRARLATLAKACLRSAAQIKRLHAALCFLRAYPDDDRTLAMVNRMLRDFPARADLTAHADVLADSGIAGTAIHYSFYYPTASWLSRRWPGQLSIDWEHYHNTHPLEQLLPVLLPEHESMALDDPLLPIRELLDHLKSAQETDAEFLLRRLDTLSATPALRQKLFEDLDIPMVLAPGPTTPSQSTSRLGNCPVFYVRSIPHKDRDWRSMRPRAVQSVTARRGRQILELARTQMITRGRDLYAFMHGAHQGVRLFNMHDGLQFACIGLEVPYRFTLETLYVYIALQSGIPVGYVQATAFLGSAEINFNVFDAFRGAQARHVFRAVLAMVRHDMGIDTFIMNTQQLGEGNEEALKTGAWWFYYKQGFRPRDPEVSRLMKSELAKKARSEDYRSERSTLKELGQAPLFLSEGSVRKYTSNNFPTDSIGLAMSTYLAQRFGADRERGIEVCAHEAARVLGLDREPSTTRHERLAWRRWAPLVLVLPGVEGWSDRDKKALGQVMLAKGDVTEANYLRHFDAHPRLGRALIALARRDPVRP